MAGFKSPQQRQAFFNALKQKQAGIPKVPTGLPPAVPLAMKLPGIQTPPNPGMAPGMNKPLNSLPTNPAAVRPANPMNFLKLRRTLRPKI